MLVLALLTKPGPILSARLKLNLTLKTNVNGWEKCKFKVKVIAENMGLGAFN